MPTEIIIRDGIVQSLSTNPPVVYDASRNADVADDYTWADINLTGNYTMDTRYKTSDTNSLLFNRNEIWSYVSFDNIRYTGPRDVFNTPGFTTAYKNPDTIIAKVISSLSANTQYSLIQGCNTILTYDLSTGVTRRFAPNDISWFAYSMTMRKGTGTDVIIDCRSGLKYISVTITNFDFSKPHIFKADGSNFYLDGTLIATVTYIQQNIDGFTYYNAPNDLDIPFGFPNPVISTTLFGGNKGYNFTTNFNANIFNNVYAIIHSVGVNMTELQTLAYYRYGATLTTPVFTATAQATLSTSQVVVFNNATFSGTIQII